MQWLRHWHMASIGGALLVTALGRWSRRAAGGESG